MFEQLVEMLNQMSETDISSAPNFRLAIMIRDEIVRLGVIDEQSGQWCDVSS